MDAPYLLVGNVCEPGILICRKLRWAGNTSSLLVILLRNFVSLPVFSDELPSGQDHKAVVSSIRELRLQAEIVAGKGL